MNQSLNERVVSRVADAVKQAVAHNKRVLLLIPGGVEHVLIAPLFKELAAVAASLTISLTDERYGPVGHPNSNWLPVESRKDLLPEAAFHPILTGGSIEKDTEIFSSMLTEWAGAPQRTVVALLGIGSDGHIAGIKPNSPASHAETLADHYEAEDFARITIAPSFFPAIDFAVLCALNPQKAPTIHELESGPHDVVTMPAELIKSTQHYEIIYEEEA